MSPRFDQSNDEPGQVVVAQRGKKSGRAPAVAMSFTQWLTMSIPMPRCDEAAIATLILVPTPSVLAAR